MPITAPPSLRGTVGRGATIGIGGKTVPGTPSEAFTLIGGIITIQADGLKRGVVETNDLYTSVVGRLGTMLDYQTVKCTYKNASSDAGQTAVTAACVDGSAYDFEIEYVDKDANKIVTIVLSAIVTQCGALDLEVDKLNQSSLELSLDGAWSVTTAALA